MNFLCNHFGIKKDAVVIENQVNGNLLAIRCINICFNFLRRQKSKMKKLFMFIMAAKAKTNDNEKEQHIIYNRNLKNRVVILTLPFYIRIKLNAGYRKNQQYHVKLKVKNCFLLSSFTKTLFEDEKVNQLFFQMRPTKSFFALNKYYLS